MKHADIIVPFSHSNENAVSMLVQNLQIKMQVMQKQKRDIKLGKPLRSFSEVMEASSPHLRSDGKSDSNKESNFKLVSKPSETQSFVTFDERE